MTIKKKTKVKKKFLIKIIKKTTVKLKTKYPDLEVLNLTGGISSY